MMFDDARQGIGSQLDRVGTMFKRATFEPSLLRVAITVAALIGFAVAYGPTAFTSAGAPALLAFSVLTALFPRGALPTMTIVGIIGGYMISTAVLGTPISWWRLAVLAAAIYLVHTCAALAAVLPYDSVVSPGLFRPWLVRLAVVLLSSVIAAVAVLVMPSVLGDQRYWVASVLGFVALLVISAYLFILSRD